MKRWERRDRKSNHSPRRRLRHDKPRIVIVGGGFGGIAAAKALRHCDAEVVVIDRRNHHIFQPLLYQVATAVLAPSEVAAPIRQLEAKQKNVSVLLAEVVGVDLESRSVDADCPGIGIKKIGFDYLVIAAGMQSSYFGHDEFAKYAPCLKTITDAETIRSKILECVRVGGIDRRRRRAPTANDVCFGRRGTDRRGIGGIAGAIGDHDLAQELSADRSGDNNDSPARRRQAHPSQLC